MIVTVIAAMAAGCDGDGDGFGSKMAMASVNMKGSIMANNQDESVVGIGMEMVLETKPNVMAKE